MVVCIALVCMLKSSNRPSLSASLFVCLWLSSVGLFLLCWLSCFCKKVSHVGAVSTLVICKLTLNSDSWPLTCAAVTAFWKNVFTILIDLWSKKRALSETSMTYNMIKCSKFSRSYLFVESMMSMLSGRLVAAAILSFACERHRISAWWSATEPKPFLRRLEHDDCITWICFRKRSRQLSIGEEVKTEP